MDNIVICELCKKEMKCISNTHLLNKHNISIEDYRKMYPDSKFNWSSGLTKYTDERIMKTSKSDFRTSEWKEKVFTPERNLKISKKLSGKPKSKEHNKKVSETLSRRKEKLGGHYFSEETLKKMSLSHIGKPCSTSFNISLENLIGCIKSAAKGDTKITRKTFWESSELKNLCSGSKVKTTLRQNNLSLDDLAKAAGLTLVKSREWKKKEDFITEVIQENGEAVLHTQKHYKGIGRIDIETETTIYEAKSYKYYGFKEQVERYKKIGKPVKVVVFEDVGETDIGDTICVKQMIKKEITLQKYYSILHRIPDEQKTLKNIGDNNEK